MQHFFLQRPQLLFRRFRIASRDLLNSDRNCSGGGLGLKLMAAILAGNPLTDVLSADAQWAPTLRARKLKVLLHDESPLI